VHAVTDCFGLQSTFVKHETTYKHKHVKYMMRPTNIAGICRVEKCYKRTKQSPSSNLSILRLVYVPNIMEQTVFSEWHLMHSYRNTPNVHPWTWDWWMAMRTRIKALARCHSSVCRVSARQHRSSRQGIVCARQDAMAVVVKFPSVVPNCTGHYVWDRPWYMDVE
jgi:hypothetical protein